MNSTESQESIKLSALPLEIDAELERSDTSIIISLLVSVVVVVVAVVVVG